METRLRVLGQGSAHLPLSTFSFIILAIAPAGIQLPSLLQRDLVVRPSTAFLEHLSLPKCALTLSKEILVRHIIVERFFIVAIVRMAPKRNINSEPTLREFIPTTTTAAIGTPSKKARPSSAVNKFPATAPRSARSSSDSSSNPSVALQHTRFAAKKLKLYPMTSDRDDVLNFTSLPAASNQNLHVSEPTAFNGTKVDTADDTIIENAEKAGAVSSLDPTHPSNPSEVQESSASPSDHPSNTSTDLSSAMSSSSSAAPQSLGTSHASEHRLETPRPALKDSTSNTLNTSRSSSGQAPFRHPAGRPQPRTLPKDSGRIHKAPRVTRSSSKLLGAGKASLKNIADLESRLMPSNVREDAVPGRASRTEGKEVDPTRPSVRAGPLSEDPYGASNHSNHILLSHTELARIVNANKAQKSSINDLFPLLARIRNKMIKTLIETRDGPDKKKHGKGAINTTGPNDSKLKVHDSLWRELVLTIDGIKGEDSETTSIHYLLQSMNGETQVIADVLNAAERRCQLLNDVSEPFNFSETGLPVPTVALNTSPKRRDSTIGSNASREFVSVEQISQSEPSAVTNPELSQGKAILQNAQEIHNTPITDQPRQHDPVTARQHHSPATAIAAGESSAAEQNSNVRAAAPSPEPNHGGEMCSLEQPERSSRKRKRGDTVTELNLEADNFPFAFERPSAGDDDMDLDEPEFKHFRHSRAATEPARPNKKVRVTQSNSMPPLHAREARLAANSRKQGHKPARNQTNDRWTGYARNLSKKAARAHIAQAEVDRLKRQHLNEKDRYHMDPEKRLRDQRKGIIDDTVSAVAEPPQRQRPSYKGQ